MSNIERPTITQYAVFHSICRIKFKFCPGCSSSDVTASHCSSSQGYSNYNGRHSQNLPRSPPSLFRSFSVSPLPKSKRGHLNCSVCHPRNKTGSHQCTRAVWSTFAEISSAYAVCWKYDCNKSQESVANLISLGSRSHSRRRSCDVILCFLVFTWRSSRENEAAKTERFSFFFVCIRAIIDRNSWEKTVVQRFSKQDSKRTGKRVIFFRELEEEKFLFQSFILDNRISMKFDPEPGSYRVLRLIL